MLFPSANATDMQSKESWAKFFYPGLKNPGGSALRSSSAIGGKQYAATSTAVSDILQGTLNYRFPSESQNITNIALTRQLANLGSPGLLQYSYLGNGLGKGQGGLLDGSGGDNHDGGSGGGTDPDLTLPGVGTSTIPDHIKNAATVFDAHPNMQISKSGHGGALMYQMKNGFTIGNDLNGNPVSGFPHELVAVRSGSIGFPSPNLINMLYWIMEGGFIIYEDWGLAGVKLASQSSSGNYSQHSWGGALDISRIGREGETTSYLLTDTGGHEVFMEICDRIMAAPQSIWPTEVGGPIEYDDGKDIGISFYDQGHSNHIHLGYAADNAGVLFTNLSGPISTGDMQ